MKLLTLLPLLPLLLAPGHARAADQALGRQIYYTTKFIESDEKILLEADILTDPQYQAIMRKFNQRKGIDILSAPSVVTRDDQSATIEVIQEFPYPATRDGAKRIFDTINVGVTLEVDGTIDGNRVELVGKAVVRELDEPVPKKFQLWKPKPQTPLSGERKENQPFKVTSFNTTETVFDASLKDGHTLLIPCRSSERINGQLPIALTATLLDASGKPIAAAATPSRPKIAKAGKKLPF